MSVVEIAHISPSDSLHHLGQTTDRLGGDQQVEVVIHQHICVHGHLKSRRLLPPQAQQLLAVLVIADDSLSIIAPLDHMVGIAWGGQTRLACHAENFNGDLTPIK